MLELVWQTMALRDPYQGMYVGQMTERKKATLDQLDSVKEFFNAIFAYQSHLDLDTLQSKLHKCLNLDPNNKFCRNTLHLLNQKTGRLLKLPAEVVVVP